MIYEQDFKYQFKINNRLNCLTRVAHCSVPASHPALAEKTVTLKGLRKENLQRRSAAQQARFQQVVDNQGPGEHFNIKSLKTGRDRVGGADHKLRYVS